MSYTGPLYVVVRSAQHEFVGDDASSLGAFMLSTSNSDMPAHVMMSDPGLGRISSPEKATKKAVSELPTEEGYASDQSTTMPASGSDPESFETTTSAKVEETLTDLMDDVLPSVGSAAHFQDQCVPCTLFAKNTCRFEQGCTFCHFEHVIKARPNKRARGRAKAYAARTSLSVEKSAENA